jgi:hypothetical protein
MKRFITVATASVLLLGTAHIPAFAIEKDHLWSPPNIAPPSDAQVEGWGENRGQTLPFSFSPYDDDNTDLLDSIARYSFDTVLANCTTSDEIGCIESIRYSTNGTQWYDAVFKRTLQQREFAYSVTTDDGPYFQPTSTWEANPEIGLLEASLPSEYELLGASHGMGDDYTINVTAISAVDELGIAKIQGLKFEAIAGGINGDDEIDCEFWHVQNLTVATPASYCYEAVDLPENLQLEVNVQLGERINELSGWFDGRIMSPTISFGTPDSPGLITVKGSPMNVNYFETLPIPDDHILFDPQLGAGMRGVWRPRTGLETFLRLESFVPDASAEVDSVWKMESWAREVMIDECPSNAGVQGIIITNATTYSPNPPSFNPETGNLEFRVASTHYLPDNTTLNRGYYNLILQESLANCLWGEGNATSASIEVKESDGQLNSAQTNIQVVDGWVNFTAENFHFSAPEILIGFKSPTQVTVNTPTQVTVNTPTGVAANVPAAVATVQTPTTVLPATTKAKKSIKVSAKSSAGLPVKVKVKGSCTVKSNMKTTVKKVGKKKVKTKSVVSYSVKLGKKGKTCTVTQTSPSNGSVAAMNSVSVIKIR